MNILAFDTCFDACSVAVGVDATSSARGVHAMFEPMSKGQAERLIPMIGEVLGRAGLVMGAIHRIVVANGPGTFTGTRIAVSAARALRLATGAEIVAVSSLEMMARHPRIGDVPPDRNLLVAINANRGEVYVQLFDGRSRRALTGPQLISAEHLVRLYASQSLAVAGSASEALAQLSAGDQITPIEGTMTLLPRAEDILADAMSMSPLASPPQPLYLRPPDAKLPLGQSIARVP